MLHLYLCMDSFQQGERFVVTRQSFVGTYRSHRRLAARWHPFYCHCGNAMDFLDCRFEGDTKVDGLTLPIMEYSLPPTVSLVESIVLYRARPKLP